MYPSIAGDRADVAEIGGRWEEGSPSRPRCGKGGGPEGRDDGSRALVRATIFLLPHPDDEYFFAPWIARTAAAGTEVYCVFTTDGTAYGADPQTRMRESAQALERLGVPEEQLLFPGVQCGIRDGRSHERMEIILESVREATSPLSIGTIYVPAWEGGNVDHDAAHLVGAALGPALGVSRIYECPMYHCHRTAYPWFHVMRLISRPPRSSKGRNGSPPPSTDGRHVVSLGPREAWQYFRLMRRFRSQWRSFAGLAPGAFLRIVVERRFTRRPLPRIDYTRRPHAGPLFYEKRAGIPFERFHATTAPFVTARISGATMERLTHARG
ncbi:MAG: PIG-L deacetylase family protein [Phycisphaerae bacterium]